MRNMSSNGTVKDQVDSLSHFKNPWDNHSAKTRYVSTAIKIEDNNGNFQPSYSKKYMPGVVFNPCTENREKTTQTDQFGFIDMVHKEIKKQMSSYSIETADQKCINNQHLSLLLAKLEKENKDLKRMALTFAVEMEEKSNALKRTASDDQNVAAQIIPTKIPTTSPSVSLQCYQSPGASSMVSTTLVNDYDGNGAVQQPCEVKPSYQPQRLLPSSFAKQPQSKSLSKYQPSHLTPVHLQRSLSSKTDSMQESTRYNGLIADTFIPQQPLPQTDLRQLKHQHHHLGQHQTKTQRERRQQQQLQQEQLHQQEQQQEEKSWQHKLLKQQQLNQKQQKEHQHPQQQQLQQQQQQQQQHKQKQQQQKQQGQQPQEQERRRQQHHHQQQQQPQDRQQQRKQQQQEKQDQFHKEQKQQHLYGVEKDRNTLLKSAQCPVQNNFQPSPQSYLRHPISSQSKHPLSQSSSSSQHKSPITQSTLNSDAPPTLPSLPTLTTNISRSKNEVVLTWDFDAESIKYKEQYKVKFYELFAYHTQDIHVSPPRDVKQWRKIGVVNALPLPMGCTLLQLANYSAFFFAVMAVDENKREGSISKPCLLQSVGI